MTAKYVALIVAGVVLAACETAKPPEAAAPPSTSILTAPVERRVVRGPIVPDDEPVVAAAPRPAPVATPIAESPAATVAVDTTTTASEAATGAVTDSTATTTAETPPVGEASSNVSVADLPPPTAPVQQAPTNTPSSTSWMPEISIGQLQAMMNANIGGFPLWLMVLIGLVLAAALIFGMSGGRREGESYAEPA